MIFNHCYRCMKALPEPGGVCSHCGSDNSSSAAMQPGHALPCGSVLAGRYVVGRMLGQGGFGITYIGYNLSLELPVCIKEYFPEGAAMRDGTRSGSIYWGASENAQNLMQGREVFVKEARKAVKLRDLSAVVKVWDVFYENDTAYIVMDYIEGETLKAHLVKNGITLGERECLALMRPVIQELAEVHRRGIIHRDISPDNLMLTPKGALVLLDMGAAKDLQSGSSQSSFVVAKQGFSPVEQYRKAGSIGPWTDVYALCATIAWCVTGSLLPTPMDRTSGETVNLGSFSPAVAAVLERGLAIQPQQRIQDMDELLSLLETALSDPQATPIPLRKPEPQPTAESIAPAKKKSGLPLLIGAAAIVALAAVFMLTRVGGSNPAIMTSSTPTESAESSAESTSEITSETTSESTPEPTSEPTPEPTSEPTPEPTPEPTSEPTPEPSPEERSYLNAEALFHKGDTARAAIAFGELGDYSDAKKRSYELWGDVAQRYSLSAGHYLTAAIHTDGTVSVAGLLDHNKTGAWHAEKWKNMSSISVGQRFIAGIHPDGSAVITPYSVGDSVSLSAAGFTLWDGAELDEVNSWTNIVAISSAPNHVVGLRADGTAVAAGSNGFGDCNVYDWTDLVAVSAGSSHSVGLKADGTVVAAGSNSSGQCDVGGWRDVVAIEAGNAWTVGLRADGTLCCAGTIAGQLPASHWNNLVAISGNIGHIVGLKADGTVLSTTPTAGLDHGQDKVYLWKDIIAISAGVDHTVGLRADGSVIAVGGNEYGQCDASGWKNVEIFS